MSKPARNLKLAEQVQVPDIDDMDDETFLKHLDLRHRHETGVETALVETPTRLAAWIEPYRAFHERQHRVNDAELYDHTHEEDW